MAKYKKGMSSRGSGNDFSNFNSGYYEPFAGYHNSNVDQMAYWNMINTPMGVIPKQFMEATIPMANDVGKKGQPVQKVGRRK